MFKLARANIAKLASFALLAGSLAGLAPQAAHADEFQTVLGAGVGAVTGAVIGNSVGGRNGAIIGAGAGGLIGASIANQAGYSRGYTPNTYYQEPAYVVQAPQPQYRLVQPVTYYQQPAYVVQAPQPQYRVVQPVTYYQPAVYSYPAPQPEYIYWREGHHHHGHHYGHHGYWD